jgi:PAS domain S-box-containing protein
MEILIVDDEQSILQMTGDFLRDCGHSVTTAADGSQALEVLGGRLGTDLILSDIRMPGTDGIELLKAVRVRYPGIPVILMTGHGDEGLATQALQQGANDYLKKPVVLADLLARVERVQERRELEAEIRGGGGPAGAQRERNSELGDPLPGILAGSRFLFVDASEELLGIARVMLAAEGGQGHTAAMGAQGLDRFEAGVYDVVVADADLPDMDGIEMVRRMSAMDPNAIFLITTGGDVRDIALRALEVGARGVLKKPFTDQKMKERLQTALAERKQLMDRQLLLGDLIEGRSDLQQRIADRERYLSHLVDSAPFAIVSTDIEGRILTFNGRAERMYGYASHQVLGRPISLLCEEHAEGSGSVRAHHRCKDGRRISVLVHHEDVLDARRHRIARLSVIEDLTEQELMESQLLEAERLSVLGQLAPRIAHEFNGPMQAILGSAELAAMQLQNGDVEDTRRTLEQIPPALDQMQALVKQMLDMGKPTRSRDEELDLGEELAKLLRSLDSLKVLRRCKVRTAIAEDLPAVTGDPAQIEQVLRNLVINAAHAMEKSPERVLELAVGVAEDGARVEVLVRDTGCGIPEEDLERIFQPFYTTKPEGQGTGLGLPIVSTIINRHAGHIAIDSTVGVGTAFTVAFPVVGSTDRGGR